LTLKLTGRLDQGTRGTKVHILGSPITKLPSFWLYDMGFLARNIASSIIAARLARMLT
jgi:hypothetical protein